MPAANICTFTTFFAVPLNQACMAWFRSTGTSWSSPIARSAGSDVIWACVRSSSGRPMLTGIDENVPAGVETSTASPLIRNRRTECVYVKFATSFQETLGPESCHWIQPWTVALAVAFQVSFALSGNDQTSSAGSNVVSTVAEYDAS